MIFRILKKIGKENILQSDEFANEYVYSDSGPVKSCNIQKDYFLKNNSVVDCAKNILGEQGDIIILLDASTVYDVGIIESIDNKTYSIFYKQLLNIFNVNILNPNRANNTTNPQLQVDWQYVYDGIDDTIKILKYEFGATVTDPIKRIPIRYIGVGGGYNESGGYNVPMVATNTDDTINVFDWIIELFNKQNIIFQLTLEFEVNQIFIQCIIKQVQSESYVIKNNIPHMKIETTEQKQPEYNVCEVIDSKTKQHIEYYYLDIFGNITTRTMPLEENRFSKYSYKAVTLDISKLENVTQEEAAFALACNTLQFGDYEHCVKITTEKNTILYLNNIQIGDKISIIPDIRENKVPINYFPVNPQFPNTVLKAGEAISTIYTGFNLNSNNNYITMYFGTTRTDYRDYLQIRDIK